MLTRVAVAVSIGLAMSAAASPLLALDPYKAITQYVHDSWTTEKGLPQNLVNNILQTRDGYLWLGTQEGLIRFDGVRFTVFDRESTQVMKSADVTSLLEGPDGSLWIGTRGAGVVRYKDGKFRAYTAKDGLSDKGVQMQGLLLDSKGVLWMRNDKGLSSLWDDKGAVYGPAQGLQGARVRAVAEADDGEIWVGTEEGLHRFKKDGFVCLATSDGLNRIQAGRIRPYLKKDGLSNAIVQSVAEDRTGDLWVGTWGGGLYRLRGGAFVDFPHREDLASEYITALLEDREGALWIATRRNGLKRLKGGELEVYDEKDGLVQSMLGALLQDSKGNLWVGSNDGLDLFSGGKFKHYTTADGLASDMVFALYEDPDGILWVGTVDGGLSFFWNGKIVSITSHDGLFSDGVFSILEDGFGNLWMTSNKGIFHIPKGEAKEFAEGKRKRVNCVAYGMADGMRIAECNGGTQPCAWKTRDGSLWFATTKGAVVLRPGPVPTNTIAPPVVIESVSSDGTPLDMALTRELEPGTQEIEFRYTAPSLARPEKVRFRYLLEGYQTKWLDVQVGRDRIAVFSNLPPGRYTFRVTACNNDGLWNEAGASWTFALNPRYYQTIWFLPLCLLAVALLAATGYKLRVRALQVRHRELTLLVLERTRELEEARLQAEGSSRAKTEFLSNMSHELRTPMNSIIGFSEVLEDQFFGPLTPKQQEHISNILSSARHLLSLINDMLDLAKVEAGRMELEPSHFVPRNLLTFAMTMVRERAHKQGIILEVVPGPGSDVMAEADERKIKQILFNLLSNAIKFTPRGKVVRVSAWVVTPKAESDDRPLLMLSVADQGIGISPDDMPRLFKPFTQLESAYTKRFEGTGLGLALTRKLVELHGGRIRVESEVAVGSTFTVEIPVNLAAGLL